MPYPLRSRATLILIAIFIFTLTSPAALQNACDLESVDEYVTRGYEHYDAEEYEQSAADFSCALELDSQDVTALTMRGNSYIELERFTEASADYTQALEFETRPKAYLYHNLALVSVLQEDDENAQHYLDLSFEEDPNYAPNFLLRGNFAYDNGDYAAAIDDYTESIHLNYDSVWYTYFNRGQAQYELGEYEAAVADFDAAIQANPDDASSIFPVR